MMSQPMSTGGIALVLGQLPFQFDGLKTIGLIFYIADVVLFFLVVIAMILRYTLAGASFRYTVTHPTECLFMPTSQLAFATIVMGMGLYAEPHTGPWCIQAMRVCFWIFTAVACIQGPLQYFALFTSELLCTMDNLPSPSSCTVDIHALDSRKPKVKPHDAESVAGLHLAHLSINAGRHDCKQHYKVFSAQAVREPQHCNCWLDLPRIRLSRQLLRLCVAPSTAHAVRPTRAEPSDRPLYCCRTMWIHVGVLCPLCPRIQEQQLI